MPDDGREIQDYLYGFTCVGRGVVRNRDLRSHNRAGRSVGTLPIFFLV